MARKTIIAILVVVVLIAVVAVAAAAGSGDDDSNDSKQFDNGRVSIPFGWRVDYASKLTSDGFSTTPDEGYKFAILSYTVHNTSSDMDITLNPLVSTWKILGNDKIWYSFLLGTSAMYLDGYSTNVVAPGGTATQVLAYQIPTDTIILSLSADLDGVRFAYDPAYWPPEPAGLTPVTA